MKTPKQVATDWAAAFNRHDAAAAAALYHLVQGGVQLIELCGIFGLVWMAKGIEATGGRVPVGSVSYGAESLAGLALLVAPEK